MVRIQQILVHRGALPSPWASLFRAANSFRVTWSKGKSDLGYVAEVN